ncbi:MAG: SCP2 sterol-binding domain-containing protein [Acidobacteria bacterium]|nr:SCP2 sterol-binding domain-containing protein [Acidobacteriota bacterium]
MTEFMTDDWIAHYARAASGLPSLEGADARVQYIIEGTAEGKKRWFEVIEGGVVTEAAPGKVADPDCTITWKFEYAQALFAGEVSHDVSFMAGRTKVEGNYTIWLDRLHEWLSSDPVRSLRASVT